MEHGKNHDYFLKTTAVCSFLGALTTALLIFLPNPDATDFETRLSLYTNGLYLSKLWILFIHPQVNLLASLGVAYLLFKKYPLQIVFGTLFLLIWAYTEMAQQSLLIDALNQIWRPGYVGADDEVSKNMFATLIKAANGISDSQYFLVIYGFSLGSLFYGAALIWENGLGKWIGIALLFIGILSLSSFARYYLGVTSLNEMVNWCYKWVYAYLQPLVRIAIGVWIFMEIKKRYGTT
ncbi:hypothetical protein [Ulvibacterium sp.]|uniref:hypothetical protein n=1 Tax=Ulvibacterium sp. TaxID=2665914 RepID=UPI003BA9C838